MFEWIGDIFAFCWNVWSIDFTFGGISFSLANVAEVAVFIWILNRVVDSVIIGDND